MIDVVDISCQDAAAVLAEQFKYEDWFIKCYAGESVDGVSSIFFQYKGRNPEKLRLYQFKGYPVLMREVKPETKTKKMDRCDRGK